MTNEINLNDVLNEETTNNETVTSETDVNEQAESVVNETKGEEQEAKKETEVKKVGRKKKEKTANDINPLGLDLVSVYDIIVKNNSAIANAQYIQVDKLASAFDAGSFLMLRKSDENRPVYVYDGDQTFMINDKPDTIMIWKGSAMLKSGKFVTYISSTSTIQYQLDEATLLPVRRFSIHKKSKLYSVAENERSTYEFADDMESLKLTIKNVSSKLYELVKDLDKMSAIKETIFSFMAQLIDINHLIKIEDQILMKYNF